jgi:hypothetical protein
MEVFLNIPFYKFKIEEDENLDEEELLNRAK